MQDEERLALLIKLEDLLVQEFRTCQKVLSLTHDERQAIASRQPARLSALVEEKEVLLDEFTQTEDRRRAVVQKIKQNKGCSRPSTCLAGLEQALPEGASEPLNRLREGILALSNKIEMITCGNRALALLALERAGLQEREPHDQRTIYQSMLEVSQRAISALTLFDMLS
jgi:flagellar biosynthesis/type III secretory pathway chaperone